MKLSLLAARIFPIPIMHSKSRVTILLHFNDEIPCADGVDSAARNKKRVAISPLVHGEQTQPLSPL